MAHPSGTNDTQTTKCTHTASTKVRDPAHDAKLELPSHWEAQTQARYQHAAATSVNTVPSPSSSTLTAPAPSCKCPSPLVEDVVGDGDNSTEVVRVVEGSSSAPEACMDHIFCILLITDFQQV